MPATKKFHLKRDRGRRKRAKSKTYLNRSEGILQTKQERAENENDNSRPYSRNTLSGVPPTENDSPQRQRRIAERTRKLKRRIVKRSRRANR